MCALYRRALNYPEMANSLATLRGNVHAQLNDVVEAKNSDVVYSGNIAGVLVKPADQAKLLRTRAFGALVDVQ